MARPLPDQRKTEILDAVLAVIIEVGFTDMTVADVAKRAGVSSALVHYHFSAKDDLIAAALWRASDEDKQRRTDVAGGTGTALERLEEVLTSSLPQAVDDASWLLWIETWGETRRSPAIREVMTDLEDHELQINVDLIDAGVAAGEFRCADTLEAARQLMALRDGLAIQRTLFATEHGPHDHATVLRDALQRVLDFGR
jgi:AcrR family transcriptional regulator